MTDPAASRRPTADHYRLRVNAFDRTASWLVATLILLTTIAAGMVIVFVFRVAAPPRIAEVTGVETEPFAPSGGERQLPDLPGLQDAPDLYVPQLRTTLASINDSALLAARIDEKFLDGDNQVTGGPDGELPRNQGPPRIGGDDCLKEMKYEPASLDDYRRMLDFFEVELAVLDPGTNKIYYAKNLTSPQPTTRSGSPQDEMRLRRFNFRAADQPLKAFEIQIARDAGIMKSRGVVLTFWPDEYKAQLYGLERERMNQHNIADRVQVKKTVFRFFRVGSEYDFEVQSQTYF